MSSTPIDQAAREEIRSGFDVNLCVEAGAGTGKTTSLVARIVELLAEGRAHVDELVAITFTEKAAAELAARVREGLEEELGRSEDEAHRKRLGEAIRGLYRSRIETIHAFAATILRERPVEAGLDPEFNVLSDLEAELSFDDAYDSWQQGLLAGDYPEVVRAVNLGLGPEELREAAEQLYRSRFLLPLADVAVPEGDAESLREWLDAHVQALREIQARCLEPEDKGAVQLDRLFAFAERVEVEGTNEAALERIAVGSIPSLSKGVGRQSSWEDPEDCKLMKRLVGEFRDLTESLRVNLRALALHCVLPHVERFVRAYEEQRRAEGLADFDDLLIWARDLLRDNLPVRRYFQRRFARVLIDEFQDTDPIQVEIAMFLCADDQDAHDWRSLQPRDGKLFVVGDPKQSIYRFRRADIAIYDEVKRGPLASGTRNLVQNFRSLPGVIEWVNRTFDALFQEEPGVQPANVRLVGQQVDPEPPIGRPPVILLHGGGEDLDAVGVRELEAASVASLLFQAIAEKWPVRDKATGDVRPARWQDVAVLLPTRTGLGAYEEALAAAGIPHRHEGSRDYFRRQEVRDFVSLLRAIDDPTDHVSIVAALRSAAFGCSDDDLVIHKATGGIWDYRPGLDSQSERVMMAQALLLELHRERSRLSLGELVQRVLEQSCLVEFVLTLSDGQQAAANLLAIADQARAFSAAGGGGLRAFARWLVQSTETEATEVDAGIIEETDDVVRILTMHGSKGLEFPVVVLASLSGAIQHFRESVPDEPNQRLHFRVGSDSRRGHFATPEYEERWNHERAAQDAEQRRLLYVAATRARDHLIVASFRGKQRPGPLLAALDEGEVLPERDGHGKAVGDMWLIDAAELDRPAQAKEPRRKPRTKEIEKALGEREAWDTERAELRREAGRELDLTVASSVERSVRPLVAEASHSASTLLVSEGPPLEIGDALHLVMQRVSLPDAGDLDEVTESVCREAGLPDHADEIREMAMRCVQSSTVKRALASGNYHREVPFTVPWNGGIATGRVDLIFRDEDELIIVDFKTDAVEPGSCEDHAAKHYSGQAEVYWRAAELATGLQVARMIFLYVRAGVEVTLGRPQFDGAKG